MEQQAQTLLDDMVQSAASGGMCDATITNAASFLSIAISLKRIADGIEGNSDRLGLVDGIMHAIEQGFIAGRNG